MTLVWAKRRVRAWLKGRSGRTPAMSLSTAAMDGEVGAGQEDQGKRMNCTTAGAASALLMSDATATPRVQKLAAPSISVTSMAAQWWGNATP